MNISPTTPPYEYEHHTRRLPGLKRIFDLIDHSVTRSDTVPSQPLSPPDLLHSSEEDDEDLLSTPSLYLSPKLSKHYDYNNHRRKSVPYKSPSLNQQQVDKSVVFQLNHEEYATNQSCPDCGDACDLKCTAKIICGQSLLSTLRKRVAQARSSQQQPVVRPKRVRTSKTFQIPKRRYYYCDSPENNSDHDDTTSTSNIISNRHHHEESDAVAATAATAATTAAIVPGWSNYHQEQEEDHQVKRVKKSPNTPRRRSSTHASGRPSRVKGPCQACQEPSDGCMRKAFNWPFPSNQVFSDKGKPFVYLCNKCGLRYNKSGGCVCRNCRWVFCKEEKRKALEHIAAMRRRRPNGQVDRDEVIENFVCSPKYWSCGKSWKVGWVLDSLEDEEDSVAL